MRPSLLRARSPLLALLTLAWLSSSAAGCRAKDAHAAPATNNGASTPVVVELFTSEGCSSCPPADAVLAKLEAEQPVPGVTIVPLAFHVDYWDELGWPDPFASRDWTRRQREYARVMARSGLYTPELVIDGKDELNGSRDEVARRSIAAAAARPKTRVTVSLAPGDRARSVRVDVAALAKDVGTVDVMLAVVDTRARVKVERGENAGRTLEHTAVVRALRKLGEAEARDKHFEQVVDVGASQRVVVFLQDRASRAIIGAGVAS